MRPGEGLGEEDGLGVIAMYLTDDPLPEGKRFRVRVIHAEDGDALLDPEQEDGEQLFPEPAPVCRLEVERIDVLILLGRIFGVLDRAVGAEDKPLRMLLDPGVIG